MNRDETNKYLMDAFREAGNEAPSILLLEDLDRVFEKERDPPVTLDCLFNCMDGVCGLNGVVIVATANHPEWLDGALRNRPGRFDRVIHFPLPAREERLLFLNQLFGVADSDVSAAAVERMADGSESFSMSHLKEVFISAGNSCFIDGRARINDDDALAAFDQMRSQFGKTRESAIGFAGHRRAG